MVRFVHTQYMCTVHLEHIGNSTYIHIHLQCLLRGQTEKRRDPGSCPSATCDHSSHFLGAIYPENIPEWVHTQRDTRKLIDFVCEPSQA